MRQAVFAAICFLPLVQRHSGRAGGVDDGFADEDGGLPSFALCFLSVSALLFYVLSLSLHPPFLQLASLPPQNFAPPPPLSLWLVPPFIYKQAERDPPALSHRGAGGSWATLPLQDFNHTKPQLSDAEIGNHVVKI
ncbi:LOW QUALITY PROTEIN: hypothetical protein NC653_010176 [Populus alba x Populus x berolinensis]|uniref:Uncharacterized protein n=1 Tax=Populus alba x Populus x berolinensis TaxID=444605 RepID=A0AAD6QZ68_9ROSI|nr:LOW QUALITY PROTEIN: hypothetical protein NC653_010176 [Populus alba x Populus x berolinensis]